MPRKGRPSREAQVAFTEDEVTALRDVVSDWIDEQLVAPPYPPALASAIRKLGIRPRVEAPAPGLPVV